MDTKVETRNKLTVEPENFVKESTIVKQSKRKKCLKYIKENKNINRSRKCSIILALICINLVIICLDSLVFIIVLKENQQKTFRSKTFSILCKNHYTHPDDDYETFFINKNEWKVNELGQYVCQTKSAIEIVEKIVDIQSITRHSKGLEDTQYLSCGNQSLAQQSGYLTVYFSSIFGLQNATGNNGRHVIVLWSKHPKHSYVHQSIPYNDGEVTIPESRTYFIYASVIFNINQTEDQKQNIPFKITLRICRKVYGYERTLLGKTELHFQSNRTKRTSLNVAGQFILQKGDVLLVRVSQGLTLDSKGNVFGLFPM